MKNSHIPVLLDAGITVLVVRCMSKQCALLFVNRHGHSELIHYLIIIIIWHYIPLLVFAFWAKSLQVLLSLAASFQFLTFSFFSSSMTSSCHHCLHFPIGLVPISFQSSSFLVGVAWSILWICLSHLILCALMNTSRLYILWNSRNRADIVFQEFDTFPSIFW